MEVNCTSLKVPSTHIPYVSYIDKQCKTEAHFLFY